MLWCSEHSIVKAKLPWCVTRVPWGKALWEPSVFKLQGLHCSIPVANKGIRVKFNHIPNYSHWHDITAPHELCVNAAQTDWLNLIPQPDFTIMVSPVLGIQSHFHWISLWAFHIQILECLQSFHWDCQDVTCFIYSLRYACNAFMWFPVLIVAWSQECRWTGLMWVIDLT